MSDKLRKKLDQECCNGCQLFNAKILDKTCVIRLDCLHNQCPCKECLVKITCHEHYSCSIRGRFVNGEVRNRWHLTNNFL